MSKGTKEAYMVVGGFVLVLVAVLATAFVREGGASGPRAVSKSAQQERVEEGPRLRGRAGPAPEALEEPETPPPERRIQGRVVCVEADESCTAAEVEVVASFQGYRHRRGFTTTWIAGRETVSTGEDGAFDLRLPDTDECIRTVFLSVTPPRGWIAPIDCKLKNGRVYVSVEIPSRIYHHSPWISLPPPDGASWPKDPSGQWAVAEIRLARAGTVSGRALDPWGERLPRALVACLWPHRDLGLTRRLVLTNEDGCFAFDVPADGREIRLELCLRPTWEDRSALTPPSDPTEEPTFVPPPHDVPGAPRPARHPWPSAPVAVVHSGARGVVLQAREEAVVEGRVVTADGAALVSGEFYVRPLAKTEWPVGYGHASERSFGSELREDGTFTLRGLRAGTWVVAFREPVDVEYMKTEPPPRTGHVVVEAPSVGATIICRPAVWIRVRTDAKGTDEQWLTPLTPSAPDDWWETGSAEPLTRFLSADDNYRRSGRTTTHAWNWWENAPGVLYVAAKDGRQALLRDVDPSAGEIHVTLGPGGTIRGTVADFHTLGFLENGLGEYTPSVWVVARRGHVVRKGRVLKGGAFEIDALPPGRWDVELQGEHVYENNPRARSAGVLTGTEDLVLRVR